MKCDRYEVLYKVVRIANSSLDFPHSCKSILLFLQQSLAAQALTFYLLDKRRTTFSRLIAAAGPTLLQPCQRPLADSLDAIALQTRQPVRQGDLWCFPVFEGRQNLGTLHLQQPFPDHPLFGEIPDIFRIVGEELARLLRYGRLQLRERQRLAQLALFSELGSELNRVGTFAELVQAGEDIVLRHSHAACVILSLCDEESVAGERHLRLTPDYSIWHESFLALEKEQAARALARRRPIFSRLPGRQRQGPNAPAGMVCIPLLLEERVLGTLSLFGSGAMSDFPFAPGREGRNFFAGIGLQFAYALERLQARERLEILSRENDRKLRETTLLYRVSRAIHSTLNLNELMHLILSLAVAPDGGGFERAMLFTVNERTETLQGILCVTRETAAFVLPAIDWERPVVTAEAQKAQRQAPCCQKVVKQRLPLASRDNPLARCVSLGQAIFEPYPENEMAGVKKLTEALDLGPFACAPLAGRDKAVGVLLVDNPLSRERLAPDRRRFFEMFASQAGSAMENSMLLHRLETAHQDLRETQARLIQGEKMATLGEMAASIAHELRNPLVPIGGFAERLGRLARPGTCEEEYTDIIIREVRRMEEMLANILIFSKKQMLCFSECRIDDIIEDALHLEAESLVHAGIKVEQEIAADLPTLQCDDQKLRQVLINLITNARQAMPDGGTLTLRAGRGKLRGEDALEVEVEDSGGGISGEVLRNLFNPFFTTKEKGTGLGLSISHRIIEHHRGEIEVKNRGQGVVFILRLPTNPNFTSQH
jgi:signal transduction histidine kinase